MTPVERISREELLRRYPTEAIVGPIRHERTEPQTVLMHPELFRAMADILKKEYDPAIFPDGFFGVTRSADATRLAGCRIGRAPAGTLSAPAVVALTTLCAMEWLRHRKAAVAAAEQSGDYSSLIEEFVAWLRALFAEWRRALAKQ